MKKVVLLACVIVVSGFGSSCRYEKHEYEYALECYKSALESEVGAYCDLGVIIIGNPRKSIENAREKLEKAKIDLEICLVRNSR